jgi:hypothetical protein
MAGISVRDASMRFCDKNTGKTNTSPVSCISTPERGLSFITGEKAASREPFSVRTSGPQEKAKWSCYGISVLVQENVYICGCKKPSHW